MKKNSSFINFALAVLILILAFSNIFATAPPPLVPLPPITPTDTLNDIFPDPALAALVSSRLGGIPTNIPVTQAQLNGIAQIIFPATSLVVHLTGIGYLNNLTMLHIKNAPSLTSIPPEIGYLFKLTSFETYNAPITLLPPEIGYWTKLKRISLWGCDETSLPVQIDNWVLIEYVDLDGEYPTLSGKVGKLQTLPIAVFPQLKDLQFQNNLLTELPSGVNSLTKLVNFDASNNKLTELPAGLATLPLLGNLNASKNHLVEALPNVFGIGALNTSYQTATWKQVDMVLGDTFPVDSSLPPILIQLRDQISSGSFTGQGFWTIVAPDGSVSIVSGGDETDLDRGVFNQVGDYIVEFTVNNGDNRYLNNSVYKIPVTVHPAPLPTPTPIIPIPTANPSTDMSSFLPLSGIESNSSSGLDVEADFVPIEQEIVYGTPLPVAFIVSGDALTQIPKNTPGLISGATVIANTIDESTETEIIANTSTPLLPILIILNSTALLAGIIYRKKG